MKIALKILCTIPTAFACFFVIYSVFRFVKINKILKSYERWSIDGMNIKGVDASKIVRDLYATDYSRDYIVHRNDLYELWERLYWGSALMGTPVMCLLVAFRDESDLWTLAGLACVVANICIVSATENYRRQAHSCIALLYNLLHYTNVCRAERNIIYEDGLSAEEKIKRLKKIYRGYAFLPSYPEHEGISQEEI